MTWLRGLAPWTALVLLLWPAAAGGSPQDAAERRRLEAVARTIERYAYYTVFDDVHAAIDGDTAVLRGKVTMPHKRADIEQRVARVEGIARVRNEIEVLPYSRLDDELRHRIARAIYGHLSFAHYAAMANPPIRIIVERGHVTLTGVVASHAERMQARALATSVGARSVRSELETTAEVRARLKPGG